MSEPGFVTIHVSVTQEDIDDGTPFDGDNCAIAQALRRQGMVFECVVVPPGSAQTKPRVVWRLREETQLPSVAVGFARRHDAGLPVSPIEFDLYVPDWAQPTQTV